MLACCEAELLTRLDKRLHGIIVRRRTRGVHESLHTLLGILAALCKLLDEFMVLQFAWWRRLNELL
jgi:hypothetical protein